MKEGKFNINLTKINLYDDNNKFRPLNILIL
jgi:hypothetical protein